MGVGGGGRLCVLTTVRRPANSLGICRVDDSSTALGVFILGSFEAIEDAEFSGGGRYWVELDIIPIPYSAGVDVDIVADDVGCGSSIV
jgi:hypothetical protein